LKLVVDGTPLEQWKLGYGDAITLLAVTLGGLAPARVSALLLAALGVLDIALDYRSLGACAVLVGANLLWRTMLRQSGRAGKLVALLAGVVLAVVLIAAALQLTEPQYEMRRMESNLGRHARLEIALQAIADSPLIGYGSWAASEHYVQMIRREEERASVLLKRKVSLGDSLMPHSQLLQAWVEGGVLAAAFFCFYGWCLLLALAWLVRRHRPGALTPLYLYTVYAALWNLAGSPFLGSMRVGIAMAIAAVCVLAREKKRARRASHSLPGFVDAARTPAGVPAIHSGQRLSGASPPKNPSGGQPSLR
jgi:O-antigen ligase